MRIAQAIVIVAVVASRHQDEYEKDKCRPHPNQEPFDPLGKNLICQ
jgi:hypothetical protein